MSESAGLSGVDRRLAVLRAEHGYPRFAAQESTTGTDSGRLVTVVADASRRLTSLSIHGDGERLPAVEPLAHAIDEAVVAAETVRSLRSYAIAHDRGLIAPTPLKRRFVTRPDARDLAASMSSRDDVGRGRPRAPVAERTSGRSVFDVLGLETEAEDATDDAGGGATGRLPLAGPVVGGEPDRGVAVTLHSDGWTSSVRLEPWLSRAAPATVERAVLDAFRDAHDRLDAVRAQARQDRRTS